MSDKISERENIHVHDYILQCKKMILKKLIHFIIGFITLVIEILNLSLKLGKTRLFPEIILYQKLCKEHTPEK